MTDVVAPSIITKTHDLNAFLARQPSSTRVLLPPDAVYKYTGSVYVPDTIELWSQPLVNGTFDGHAVVHREVSYEWRIVPDTRQTINGQPNPAYNPRGICSEWQYDLQGGYAAEPESLKNRYAVKRPDGTYSAGAQWGGYDATTHVTPDGHLHLAALYGQPWSDFKSGDIIQWLIVGGTMGTGQAIIGSQAFVNSTGTDIDLGPNVHPDGTRFPHVDTSGTVSWCRNKRGAGWGWKFMSDDTVPVRYVTPNKNRPWNGYIDALARQPNDFPIHVKPGGKAVGIEVVGANHRRDLAIPHYDKSDPVVNEFHRNIFVEEGGQVIFCRSHHAWGDGCDGPGEEIWCKWDWNGRTGTCAHYNGKKIIGAILDSNHGAAIDIEASGPVSDVEIDAMIGGTGVAISSPVNNLKMTLRSMKGAIDSGSISAYTGFVRGARWSGGGTNWDVQLHSDQPAPTSGPGATAPAVIICNVDGLNLHDSAKPTGGYFLKPYYSGDKSDICKNITTSNLNGGPKCKGPVQP